MQPSRRHCLCASLVAVVVLTATPRASADKLTITSTPSGASIEIDGKARGFTPFEADLPGGYFHKTHTVFGSRLEHSLVLRISKPGYASQEVTLTSGPYDWISVNGRRHGSYFLLKSDRFDIRLEPAPFESENPEATGHEGPLRPAPNPSDPEKVGEDQQATGKIRIESDPAGADIYVDGKFAGQTPSTIRLPSGNHHIELKLQGKNSWQRDLQVWKGSQLTLSPELDQKD